MSGYVKDDVGGSALSRVDAALIIEELATAAAYISIHRMAARMIDAFGDDDQRRRFLPKLCSMQHFAMPDRAGGGFDQIIGRRSTVNATHLTAKVVAYPSTNPCSQTKIGIRNCPTRA